MLMTKPLPTIRHIYQNHTLDSTRWEHYSPRPDDIIIATPYKSGTTWMQIIVMHLIFHDLQLRPFRELSPWLDVRWREPVTNLLQNLEEQNHRRFIKTHLPLDGLPYFEKVKYIVVGRDARDVFMSLWHFYRGFGDNFYERVNRDWPGKPFPLGATWEWESEGYPFWSNLRHVQTWWNFKHLPNILFVHFNDLLGDLETEIQRVADFLEINVAPDLRSNIAEVVTFKQVKQNAEQLGKKKKFFHKGTNGRWRTVLSDDELQLYQAAVARELSPDCALWLENGQEYV